MKATLEEHVKTMALLPWILGSNSVEAKGRPGPSPGQCLPLYPRDEVGALVSNVVDEFNLNPDQAR